MSAPPTDVPSPSPLADPAKSHLQVPAPGGGPYSSTSSSRSGSETSLHRIKNVPGYTTPVFKGKEEQRAKVQANIAAKVSTRRPFALSYPIAVRPYSTLCE